MLIERNVQNNEPPEAWVRGCIRSMNDMERMIALEELGKIGMEKINADKHLHSNVN